jgi:hypothetical protein
MRQARGPAVAARRMRARDGGTFMRRAFALSLALSVNCVAVVVSALLSSSSAPQGNKGTTHGAAGRGTGGGGSTGAVSSSNLQQQQQLKIAFVTGNAMKVCIVAVRV